MIPIFQSGTGSLENSAGFQLLLNDLGAGAVNTTPQLSGGSPTATFTRATAATTIGPTGLVVSVATGVARSYYDPASLIYLGFLSEPATTNLALRSEDFSNASWVKTDTTITADNTTAPDGAATADLLTEGTAGTALVAQTFTGTSNATYTVTQWAKRGNTDWMVMRIHETAASANFVLCYYNLNTGAVGTPANGGTGSGATGRIKAYPSGWYRLELTGAVNNSATALTFLTASATADGNGARVNNSTRFQWGAQFEDAKAFSTTYQPTVGSTVARNADALSFAYTSNADATQGTCYAELTSQYPATNTSGATAASLVIGASSFGLPLVIGSSAAVTAIVCNDSTTSATKSGLTSMFTGVRKRASSWGGAGMSVTGDGATVATAVFDGAMGATLTTIGIGCTPSATLPWNGTIKNLRIWLTQLTDAQIQYLTVS